jgi:hypothetical protein
VWFAPLVFAAVFSTYLSAGEAQEADIRGAALDSEPEPEPALALEPVG